MARRKFPEKRNIRVNIVNEVRLPIAKGSLYFSSRCKGHLILRESAQTLPLRISPHRSQTARAYRETQSIAQRNEDVSRSCQRRVSDFIRCGGCFNRRPPPIFLPMCGEHGPVTIARLPSQAVIA